jgi:Tfp pilus assembly protein PilN
MIGSVTTTGTMPRVNLLPPEIAEKATLRKAQFAMAGVGAAAVAVVGLLYVNASHEVSEANEQKAEVAAASVKLNAELKSLQNVRDVYARVDAAKLTLASAMKNEVLWSSYLHDLTLRVPDNVWLTSLSASVDAGKATGSAAAGAAPVLDPGIGTVNISGVAFDHPDVAKWLESLSQQKGFANAYFTQSTETEIADRTLYKFTTSVNLTQAALSNRYTKGTAR